jgi:hypothetical protein
MPTAAVERVAPRNGPNWTVARPLLYDQLTKVFGPHETWEKHHRPGKELDKYYRKWLKVFVEISGAKSVRAVTQQIDWATMKKPLPNGSDSGRYHNWIKNKAAALDHGFIKSSEILEENE